MFLHGDVRPDELSVVVGLLRQKLDLPPVQKLVQRSEGVLCDGTLVGIAPHLQAHQGHPDIQGPVELEGQKNVGNCYWYLLLYGKSSK